MLRILVFLLFLVSSHGLATANGTRSATESNASVSDTTVGDAPSKSDIDVALLQKQLEISDAGFNRLENVLAGFGIVMTIAIVAFGIATHKSAVAAARDGIGDELAKVRAMISSVETEGRQSIDGIRASHSDFRTETTQLIGVVEKSIAASETKLAELNAAVDARLNEAETVLARARQLLDEAARQVDQIAMKKILNESLSPFEEQELEIVSRAAQAQTINARSTRQSLALIAAAIDRSDWRDVEMLAKDIVDDGSDLARSASIFYAAVAMFHTSRYQESLDKFLRVIDQFHASDDPNVQLHVAKSEMNLGINLNHMGKYDESVRRLAPFLSRQHPETMKHIVTQASLAMAFALDELGRYPEAIEILSALYDELHDSAEGHLKTIAFFAAYNRACAFSKLGQFESSADSLRAAAIIDAASIGNWYQDGDLSAFRESQAGRDYRFEMSVRPKPAP